MTSATPAEAAPGQSRWREGFRADVEGLRAVAVLLVVGAHLLGAPRGGYVGVDVFFVISGYLITGLLVRELAETGWVDLPAFYRRRARRILPAALVVLGATVVAAHLLLLPLRAQQVLTDAGWAAGFLANVRFALLGTDYFAADRPPSPVQHYWSLAVEEQFYVVWPALLLAIAVVTVGRGRAAVLRVLVTVVAVVLLASLVWSVLASAGSPQTAYFSTFARAFELAAGALLALAVPRLRSLPRAAATTLAAAGLVGLAVAAVVLKPGTPFPGWAAVLPVAATCALLAAGCGRDGLSAPSRLLTAQPARYVGRISYSLYLWHWPVLVLGEAVLGEPALPTAVGLLLLSVLLAAASYRLVERPFLQAGGPRFRWRPLAAAAALGGVVAVAGTLPEDRPQAPAAGSAVAPRVVEVTPGVPAQAEPPNVHPTPAALSRELQEALRLEDFGPLNPPLDALDRSHAPEWIVDRCLDVSAQREVACRYGPPQAPRLAVVLGDSIAASWLPGLRAALEPRGFRFQTLTRRACPLGAPDAKVSPACRDHRARALRRVEELRPAVVVVSGSYVAGAAPLSASDTDGWQRRLAASLRPAAARSRVVVLASPPTTGNLQGCASRVATPQDCVREIDPLWFRLAAADAAAARAAGARFVDVRSWFCVRGACPPVVDGTPVMADGKHLTAAHSRRLAVLLRQVVLGPP